MNNPEITADEIVQFFHNAASKIKEADWDDVDIDDEDPQTIYIAETTMEYALSVGAVPAADEELIDHDDWAAIEADPEE